MTDIVKELYKGEVLAGNFVNGTQTLYTTDSTKTAVIKDVHVASEYPTAPTLQAGDFDIVSLSSSASGSEIVGTNSTIKIKNNTDLSSYKMASVSYVKDYSVNPVEYYPSTTPSSFFNPATSTVSLSQGTPTTIAAGALLNTTSNYWAYVINNFVYYYQFDGNSTTRFYYRDITTGTQTTVNTEAYAPVTFDGVDKFYFVNQSGQLRMLDAQTNTVTTLHNGWPTGTTFPAIFTANNIIFWRNTNNAATMYFYNRTTGTPGSFSVSTSLSMIPATTMFYDSSTNIYSLVWASNFNSSTNFNYIDLQSNATGTVFTAQVSPTSVTPKLNGVNKQIKIAPVVPAGTLHYAVGSTSDSPNNNIYSMTKDGVLTQLATVANETFGLYTSGLFSFVNASSSDLNTFGPKINLRITGVETTL